jgi:hypothetical protein
VRPVVPTLPAPPATSSWLPSWALHALDFARPLASQAENRAQEGLHWVSAHTGLPGVVIGALGLVLAWRVASRTWYVIFELAVAFALLFAATHFGWIRW